MRPTYCTLENCEIGRTYRWNRFTTLISHLPMHECRWVWSLFPLINEYNWTLPFRYMYVRAMTGLETDRLWPMSVFGAFGILLTWPGHGLPRSRTAACLRTNVHRRRYDSPGSIRPNDSSSAGPENATLWNGSEQNLKITVHNLA